MRDKIKERKEKNKRMDEAKVEALCEHLKRMGLDATVVKFKKRLFLSDWPGIIVTGAARIANRNIDLVELAWYMVESGGTPEAPNYETKYRCNYVVRAKVQGLEDWLKVELKPVRKGFLKREIVDLKWEEKVLSSINLAQVLNSDSDLKHYFLSQRRPPNVEIEPYRKHQCVRIWQKYSYDSSEAAFPTIENFEAYDRIAKHVRSTLLRTVAELIKN